jgi:hypothetical protein
MYSACLYCSHSLNRNEVVEAFPIGRRLAYDAAKGRLWVVCPSCLRWCLSPIEERWEAIETCEKHFRESRVRASTSEISLTKLSEGLELVRIGAPLRPEMAAWRYGREFSARRRRTLAIGVPAVGLSALGAVAAIASGAGSLAAAAVVIAGAPALHMIGLTGFAAYALFDSARATRLVHDGRKLIVYREDLNLTHLRPTDDSQGWGLMLKHSYGRLNLDGDDATRITSRLLARVNGAGASKWLVDTAAIQLAAAPDLRDLLRETATYSAQLAEEFTEQLRQSNKAVSYSVSGGMNDVLSARNPGSLKRLAPHTTLALEMALHEESERIALEGELAPLRESWREAEFIAGIADALLVPPAVNAKLASMRARDGEIPSSDQ